MAFAGNARAAGGLLRDAWIEYQRDRARYLAMAIIYYAAICLVPMMLLLLSTLGLLLRYSMTAADLERQVIGTIETRFGPQLSATITGLLDTVQRDSMAATIVGGILARVPILPGVGLLVAVLSSFVLAAITYGALLMVLPPRVVRWRDIVPSLLLCAGIWVAASELIPLYHRFFGESRNAYNAIGSLLPVLVLVNIGAQSLFYGAELTKVVTRRGEARGRSPKVRSPRSFIRFAHRERSHFVIEWEEQRKLRAFP